MSACTTYTKAKLLNLLFSATAWSGKPTSLYFGLFTTAPTVAGGGTEVSTGGYARVAKTATDSTHFTVSGMGVTNATAITFAEATADWGSVLALGVFDAPSGGNLLFFVAITPQTVVRGISLSMAIGAFTVTFGGNLGAYGGNKLALHVFNGTAMPTISTHYYGLGTGATYAGVSGEPTVGTGAYARATVVNNVTNYPAAVSEVKTTGADIAFATSSAAWSSGAASLPYWAIFLDATIGSDDCLWFGLLDQAVVVDAISLTPTFATGALELTME